MNESRWYGHTRDVENELRWYGYTRDIKRTSRDNMNSYTSDDKWTSRDDMVMHDILNKRAKMIWLYTRC